MSATSSDPQPHGAIRTAPETNEIVALCLEGEFDIANVSTLRAEIDHALANTSNLILDLARPPSSTRA